MDWLSWRVRLATCLGNGLDWLLGTLWELKKFNISQLNQLKKLNKLTSGRDPPRTNVFKLFNWFSWEVLIFFNSEGVPAQLNKLNKLKKLKKMTIPDPGSGGSGRPAGQEAGRGPRQAVWPLWELKKINTSQLNQLKKLKKLPSGRDPPGTIFFNFFNWFSWEVLNFFNSQRWQTARLEPLPASWPARPPDPGSGIVNFFIFFKSF